MSTRVSGTTVFGAATDESYAFDVLIHLRDSLYGQPQLSFGADVTASGAANPAAFTGIASATDLKITGPSGTAFVGPTVAGDDTVSYSGNATSAVAVAARINLASATTGVTATATRAQITYAGGTFASDVTLDGTAGRTLVINGVAILGAVSGGSAARAPRRPRGARQRAERRHRRHRLGGAPRRRLRAHRERWPEHLDRDRWDPHAGRRQRRPVRLQRGAHRHGSGHQRGGPRRGQSPRVGSHHRDPRVRLTAREPDDRAGEHGDRRMRSAISTGCSTGSWSRRRSWERGWRGSPCSASGPRPSS